jgi:hypothetical protein
MMALEHEAHRHYSNAAQTPLNSTVMIKHGLLLNMLVR